ncbi:hypothetical protein GpartN1_g7816.t1 [Galdieria partita]|uniref:Uncharacterized protein n=1 Tax=Galdieria partita TaxID=83374 RepID=A0A9C7Q3T4_9RHOD|nr:hypothetical protein GpartN1_g7784.t1 [Galdieria partita]GJQ16025.1 hypothetical protein GpartN1_g7816.t1 [Galdieria partita]
MDMILPPRLSQCHVSLRLPKIENKSILESLTEPDREFVVNGEVLKAVILLRPKGIPIERLRALISFLELSYSFEVSVEEKVGEHAEDRVPTTHGVYVFPTHRFAWSCPSLTDLPWQQIETDSYQFALISEYPVPVSLPRNANGKEVILQIHIRESTTISTDSVADSVQMVYQREKSTPLLNMTMKRKLQVIEGFQSRYWFTRTPCGSFLCFAVQNMLEEFCLQLDFPTLDIYSSHMVHPTMNSQDAQYPVSKFSTVDSISSMTTKDSDGILSYISVHIPGYSTTQTEPLILRPKEEYCFVFHFTWKTDQFPCADFMDPLMEVPLRFFWHLCDMEMTNHSSTFLSNEFLSECVQSVRWKLPSKSSAISISFSGPQKVVVNQVFSVDITIINKSQEDILQGLLLLQEKHWDENKSSSVVTITQGDNDYTLVNDSTPLHVQFPKSILALGRVPKQECITIRTDVTVTKQGLIRLPPVHLLDKSTGTRWRFEYAFEVFATALL